MPSAQNASEDVTTLFSWTSGTCPAAHAHPFTLLPPPLASFLLGKTEPLLYRLLPDKQRLQILFGFFQNSILACDKYLATVATQRDINQVIYKLILFFFVCFRERGDNRTSLGVVHYILSLLPGNTHITICYCTSTHFCAVLQFVFVPFPIY